MLTKEEILKRLATYDNDKNFHFDEPSHTYTYGKDTFTSVTTFLSRFHKKFDSDFWSKRNAQRDGVTQEEVLKAWQDKNDYANMLGHSVHMWIENYYNNVLQELPTNLEIIDRINKFNVIFANHLSKLEHVKCEQRIYSRDKRIAGMIDTLFLYKGQVFIIDWKTNLKWTDDSTTTYSKLLYPFSKYWENQHNEYSIQQSLYALILEEIGIEVKAMYLCYIGPNEPAKMHKVVDMRPELKEYFKKEKQKEEARIKGIDDSFDIDDYGLNL